MARKLLIGFGVLVALLVVALIALVTLVDVNRFKPQITQAVQDRFNRKLTIDGDLSLTVFPRIGVALPKTTLSEHRGDATFASLDRARVSVALLPLLSGRIEAGTISVVDLTATIDKRADGTTNVDDLLKGDAAAPTAPPKDAAGPPQFEIGGIELVNANLTYRDLAAKNTVTLTQLNLTAGRVATTSRTPVDLSTRFASTAPAAQGELAAEGELDLDLVKQAFGARGLNLTLKATLEQRPVDVTARAGELRYDGASGALSITKLDATAQGALGTTQLDQARVDVPTLAWDPRTKRLSVGGVQVTARGKLGADAQADSFEANLAAPKIDVTETNATGERVTASVKLGGAQRIDAKLTLDGISGSAKDLKIGTLSIAADVVQPIDKARSRHIVAQLASPASASIDGRSVALPKIAGDITMEDPALPQKSVKLPITASFSLDALKEVVAARLLTKFDETTLNAEFDVRGFATPRLAFDASVDKLNLDRYFPPAPTRPADGSTDPAPGAAADAAVDLSALKSLNLTGQAQVGQLQARGIKVQNLRVGLKAGGGRLDVAPLTAGLYGGTVNANAFAQADNRVGLDAALTNVNIEPLMKDAIDKDLLAGRGNVKLDIRTSGATVNGMKRGLNRQRRGGAARRCGQGDQRRADAAQRALSAGRRPDRNQDRQRRRADRLLGDDGELRDQGRHRAQRRPRSEKPADPRRRRGPGRRAGRHPRLHRQGLRGRHPQGPGRARHQRAARRHGAGEALRSVREDQLQHRLGRSRTGSPEVARHRAGQGKAAAQGGRTAQEARGARQGCVERLVRAVASDAAARGCLRWGRGMPTGRSCGSRAAASPRHAPA
jgi:AsmA protein